MHEFIREDDIPDDKMIDYKQDGETKQMPAKSAKTMKKDHPAKQAYDALKKKGDSGETPGANIGGSDFDRDGGDAQKGADSAAGDGPKDYTGSIEGDERAGQLANNIVQGADPDGAHRELTDMGHGDLADDLMKASMYGDDEEAARIIAKASGEDMDSDDEDWDSDDEDDYDDDDYDYNAKGASEKENENIEKELQNIAKDKGLTVGSEPANHGGDIHNLVGKDDDPDNVLGFHAAPKFDDDGNETDEVQYAIELGLGSSPIYFDSKEEAEAALQKITDDQTVRDSMDGESDPPGVYLSDLDDHVNNLLKSDDDKSKRIPAAPMETKVINGVKYRAIKESKKPKKHILKENYDRFFGDK